MKQPSPWKTIVDKSPQVENVKWFLNAQIVHTLEKLARLRREYSSCQKNHIRRLIGINLYESRMKLHASNARHHQIAEDDVVPNTLSDPFKGLFRNCCPRDVVSIEHFINTPIDGSSSITKIAPRRDDVSTTIAGALTGSLLSVAGWSSTVNSEPRPTSLSTVMVPPISLMIR